jgi:hypothetical protein
MLLEKPQLTTALLEGIPAPNPSGDVWLFEGMISGLQIQHHLALNKAVVMIVWYITEELAPKMWQPNGH